MTIKLDLRDLHKVDPTALEPGQCMYTAPCVVGAMMTPEERESLDKIDNPLLPGTTCDSLQIEELVKAKLVEVPEDQLYSFIRLQESFDGGSKEEFEDVFTRIKDNYSAAA